MLLVRGARQIGKTFSIRQLGISFKYFIEVNFDFDVAVRQFFNATLDPLVLCEKLSGYYSIPCIPGKTLLFFDEIQACPQAIQSLRYFYERMPAMHVIAAGSLLEFALEQLPSFGVGRISSLYMYPMTFSEFVAAKEGAVQAALLKIPAGGVEIEPVFHAKFLELFRTYSIIGGMPAVVNLYKEKSDLLGCQNLLDELLATFKDDFAKYKTRISQLKIFETLKSVSLQAGRKFMYTQIADTGPQTAYKQALDLLEMAGLVHKVYHTAGNGIPLGAEINGRKFKGIPPGLGLHQRLLGLELSRLLTDPLVAFVNKGSIAEVFAGLELCAAGASNSAAQLFYWHRETHSSNAEVDYLIQNGADIVPLEVKSGRRGSMQSMSVFMSEHKSKYGIRLALENCARYKNIIVTPLYLAACTIRGVSA
ncbi:MAG: AAA family ATPase [Chitinivibrionales bacterium]|nr:AAA family ATPase [Chitinivibrionales bacterium]